MSRAEEDRVVRRRTVRTVVSADDTRRKREQLSVKIRKEKRDAMLQKRRAGQAGAPALGVAGAHGFAQGAAAGCIISNPQQDVPKTPEEIQAMYNRLREMTMKLQSAMPLEVKEAASYFRRLLSIEENPPIDDAIAMGAVQPLVALLVRSDEPQMQFDAAWALTNIASGTSQNTHVVVESGAVGPFVQLLCSPVPQVREQSAWALGNIAGDCAELRDMVLAAGALVPVVEILRPHVSDVSTQRNATWTLSNFCRGKQSDQHLEHIRGALPVLANLVRSEDPHIVIDSCWALSYVSNGSARHIDAVLGLNVLDRLIALASEPNRSDLAKARLPALRTIGNIIAGNDVQTDYALRSGAVPALLLLAGQADRKLFRKEACWTISNVTAGTLVQIEEVMKRDGIPVLLKRLEIDDPAVATEACWAISNALVGGEVRHVNAFVEAGTIATLTKTFASSRSNDLLQVALEAFERILEVGEQIASTRGLDTNPYADMVDEPGLGALEDLQDVEAEEVGGYANKILSRFFNDVAFTDDEDDGMDGPDLAMAQPAPIAANVPQQVPAPQYPQSVPQFGFPANPPAGGGFSGFGDHR